MYGYGIEPIFWIKLIVVLGVFLLVLMIFNMILRKWLKVEKKKFFSYNYVNKKHEKIDWTLRIIFIAALIISNFINIERNESLWYLETWFIMFSLIFFTEAVRVFMEWRHAENKNDYLFTLSQLVFCTVIVTSFMTTDYYGVF